MREDVRNVAREFVRHVREDDATGLAAELAYRFLFALFPFGIFVAAALAFGAQWLGVESGPQQIVQGLGDNLPPDLAAAVQPELERVIGETRPGLLSVGAIGALFAATGATLALVKAMNRAYEVEDQRSFVRRYATAIALTLLATLGIVVSFVSIVGGTLVTEELAEGAGWGGTAWAIANLARWPAAFLLLTVAVGALLRFAPNVAAPWRLTLAGGALFALGWLGATFGFAWYATNVGNYGSTYGALAAVIVLMFWFYLSALLLVFVAQLVAMATKQWAPERIEQSRRLDGAAEDVAGAAGRLVDGVKDAAGVDGGNDRPPDGGPADEAARPTIDPVAHRATARRTSRRAPAPAPSISGSSPAPSRAVVGAAAAAGAAVALVVAAVAHAVRGTPAD